MGIKIDVGDGMEELQDEGVGGRDLCAHRLFFHGCTTPLLKKNVHDFLTPPTYIIHMSFYFSKEAICSPTRSVAEACSHQRLVQSLLAF
mmetsp:Transcript_17678/g.44919  ORF Transcript_17678/g.44919 Transcript_17678/m.44919 type:complete len:89 (+) Transcript_17678:240-506(+)